MGPWSVISGVTTLAMLPRPVDARTRRRAVQLLARVAPLDDGLARLVRRAQRAPAARAQLEQVITAFGRVLLAAREGA